MVSEKIKDIFFILWLLGSAGIFITNLLCHLFWKKDDVTSSGIFWLGIMEPLNIKNKLSRLVKPKYHRRVITLIYLSLVLILTGLAVLFYGVLGNF
jgi:hypothetical protein